MNLPKDCIYILKIEIRAKIEVLHSTRRGWRESSLKYLAIKIRYCILTL